MPPVARRNRSWRREAEHRELTQETPFTKAPRAVLTRVQIPVVEQTRHGAAAPVVAQHPAPRIIAKKDHGAAATRLPLGRSALAPPIAVEPAVVGMAAERCIV